MISRSIRRASPADIRALQGIEAAADELFAPLFGPQPFGPDSAADGAARAAEPGFVLVVAEAEDGPAIGFAHVLWPFGPGDAHLEQLAVLPAHLRRGHGRALVEAAVREASEHGARRMTLRTFAQVPWNGPFYAACGFAPIAPIPHPAHRAMVAVEERLGLAELGERVLMARDLGSPAL
ncbi:GNAT family N-acetyltransferase [Brachybacterium phenoliresistens]|uniref:GNAT family N-acetyltransferase n=1 Tax=Brachybacterium phenoliresistens TaxID=396014 RepID=UPI0004B2A44E|nr:GNAT family N-acetyltransferase [Brachybacterium phenoliresistens]